MQIRYIFLCVPLLICLFALGYSEAWAGQGLISTSDAISNQTMNLLSPSILINNEISQQVSNVGQDLLQHDSTDEIQSYRFHVLCNSTPNSFSLPSGDIFITTGLLDFVKSKDELAMVLGREIAFLQEDIGLRSYRQEKSKQTMVSVTMWALTGVVMYFQVTATLKAAEESPTGTSVTSPTYYALYGLANIPQTILNLSRNSRLRKARLPAGVLMGREESPITFDMFLVRTISEGYEESAELAADDKALHLAFDSGWDPEAQLSLMERLVSADPYTMSHLRSFLAKRIIQAETEIQKVQNPLGGRK